MSWRKLKYLKLLNRKKGPLFFYINSDKIETTLTPTLDQTSFPETFNIPVVMSQRWILLAVVAQLVAMLLSTTALGDASGFSYSERTHLTQISFTLL